MLRRTKSLFLINFWGARNVPVIQTGWLSFLITGTFALLAVTLLHALLLTKTLVAEALLAEKTLLAEALLVTIVPGRLLRGRHLQGCSTKKVRF